MESTQLEGIALFYARLLTRQWSTAGALSAEMWWAAAVPSIEGVCGEQLKLVASATEVELVSDRD